MIRAHGCKSKHSKPELRKTTSCTTVGPVNDNHTFNVSNMEHERMSLVLIENGPVWVLEAKSTKVQLHPLM